jgi:hypothetical protein
MITPDQDDRSAERKLLDEEIAAASPLPLPDLPPGTTPLPMEVHLQRLRRPIAVPGVVENGLVRPLDPAVQLPEHARVVIVAASQ